MHLLLGLSVPPRVPPYFDWLVDAFHRGESGRSVHLGCFDDTVLPGPGEFARAQARLDARVLALAACRDEHRVLDVACGFGGTLAALAHPRAVGVNVDARQLAICATLPGAWVQADAVELPFAAKAFERVLCVEAMFHFASRAAFFAEAARVLAPGGTLTFTDIRVLAAALPHDTPDFPIAATLQAGYGPWPDPYAAPHDPAPLAIDHREDVTDATRPSHRFTAPEVAFEDAPPDPGLRAGLMLRWLHERDLLVYELVRCRKAGV